MNKFFYTEEPFVMFSTLHLISALAFGAVGASVILIAKSRSERTQYIILSVICYLLNFMIVSWAIIEISLDRFNIINDLPLIFCNLMAFLAPVYLRNRSRIFFNVFYYLIIVGAIQSVITPGLKLSIPHYEYWKFWTVHIGLITLILYEIIIFKKRPDIQGIWQTFLIVQAYVIFIILLNFILDSNYLYLNIKPKHNTLLALLGGWPYYIILMDVLLIPYFFITYLPFKFLRKRNLSRNFL